MRVSPAIVAALPVLLPFILADYNGNLFADTVPFKAGKAFDTVDLDVGDGVELTATPAQNERLLRPARIKRVA